MRQIFTHQISLDHVPIEDIQLDVNSRDPLVAFLFGIQSILTNNAACKKLTALLKTHNPEVSKHRGRPGMNVWVVVLLAAIKQELNCTYDRLATMANQMGVLRLLMGHGTEDEKVYTGQALHDNITLVSSTLLQKLNQLIIEVGHQVVGHQSGDLLKCHADSKVSLTNVAFPTDLALLWKSTASLIRTCVRLTFAFEVTGWRQQKYLHEKLEKLFKFSRKGRRSAYRLQWVKKFLKYSNPMGEKAKKMLEELSEQEQEIKARLNGQDASCEDQDRLDKIQQARQDISFYLHYMALFSDQITRRIFDGETIPQQEKVYSIFKPFTRWIVKGKAGILMELGVPVAIIEDDYQFVLGYGIEWKGTDIDMAVPLVQSIEAQYPHLTMTCSFDLGFYSPEVREQLETKTNLVVIGMFRKGRLSKEEKERQTTEEYKEARQGHSRVESCMNVLNHRGMRLIREVGKEGFERVVACTIVAVNIHRLGTLIQQKQLKRLRRKEKREKRLRQAA